MRKHKTGWFCTYTPTEIAEAAGCQAVGIRTDSGREHEEVYLGDAMCSYVRSCLGGAVAGIYDDLDSVIIAHSCECMRRLNDGWNFKQKDIKPENLGVLDIPRICTEQSIEQFRRNLEDMRSTIEKKYGEIPEESLRKAIKENNLTRKLFLELNGLRKQSSPPLTGVEMQEIIKRSMTEPREEFNSFLERRLGTLRESDNSEHAGKARIMIYTGVGNEGLCRSVEDAGGIVVYEHACNGIRAFDTLVDENTDPLTALARRYLSKSPCPRMLGDFSHRAISECLDIIKDYRIDGIIYYSIKFCSNLQMNFIQFREMIEAAIPVKVLEGDISEEVNSREITSFIRKIARRSAA